MVYALYPISELGVLWLQATLTVALTWLVVRTKLMPVVVASAVVYTGTILLWATLVQLDVPTVWGLQLDGRDYPALALGGSGFLLAFIVLHALKRRERRSEAPKAPAS
jgi:hypothetical protein